MGALHVEFTDASGLLASASDFLASAPVINTVLTTLAHRLADEAPQTWPQWFAIVRDGSSVVGIAMRTASTAPHPIYVLPMSEAAANEIVRALDERGEPATSASGFLPAARTVAVGLARGRAILASQQLRLFELGTLVEPRSARGYLRNATLDDLDLAFAWLSDFHRAADEQAGRTEAGWRESFQRDGIRRRIDAGGVWLWIDGRPVHLTAAHPASFGVARIGPVYTPSEHRGHGYASATVFAISGELQRAGVRVCLFADEKNSTSNKIYEALGFHPVADSASYVIT